MNPDQKERTIIAGGIVFIMILVIGVLATMAISKSGELEDSIQSKKRILAQMGKTAVEYSQAVARTRNIQSRLGQDSTPLLSYLENLSRQAKVNSPTLEIIRTSPNDFYEESAAELKAKGLTLRQLLNLLNLIENSTRYLRVKHFQIKTPYATPDLLDVTLQVSTYVKKAAPEGKKSDKPQEKKPENEPDEPQ